MDEITKIKTRFRMEHWIPLIKECQNSGLPVRSWCSLNNVSEQSYYYWLKRIRKVAYEQQIPAIQRELPKPVEFAKLQVNTNVPNKDASVIIHLPSVTLEVKEGASQQTVEAVLRALKNLQPGELLC